MTTHPFRALQRHEAGTGPSQACGQERLEAAAPLGSTDLRVDLVQAWPVIRSFLPALLHQLDALTGALVRGHQWPAQRRGRCHLPDDLCSKPHGYLGSRCPEGLWEGSCDRAGKGESGPRNAPRTFRVSCTAGVHTALLFSWICLKPWPEEGSQTWAKRAGFQFQICYHSLWNGGEDGN